MSLVTLMAGILSGVLLPSAGRPALRLRTTARSGRLVGADPNLSATQARSQYPS